MNKEGKKEKNIVNKEQKISCMIGITDNPKNLHRLPKKTKNIQKIGLKIP